MRTARWKVVHSERATCHNHHHHQQQLVILAYRAAGETARYTVYVVNLMGVTHSAYCSQYGMYWRSCITDGIRVAAEICTDELQ